MSSTDAAAGGRELREALVAVGTVAAGHLDAATHLLNGAMNDAALWLADRPGDDRARASVHDMLDLLIDAVVR